MSDEEVLEALRRSLPNLNDTRGRLLNLRFFALCPNGKRIPVEQICEEYAREPQGLALRTFDNRLVLVIQAVFPDDSIYWQQAFYMSTGMNSGMPGTWLPFDGIVMRGSFGAYMRPTNQPKSTLSGLLRMPSMLPGPNGRMVPFKFAEPPKPKQGNRKTRKEVSGIAWFSKFAFVFEDDDMVYAFTGAPPRLTLEEKKRKVLKDIYGSLYLPEGDYLKQGYGFSRFGTLSYALASHRIGSNIFRRNFGRDMFPSFLNDTPRVIKTELNKDSQLQPCFEEMSTTYPIAKPNLVNRYIEDYKGFSYMNSFRQEGIFPPGLSFLNTPIIPLGYSMPLQNYEEILTRKIRDLWNDYKLGTKTLDEIRAIFANPRKAFQALEKDLRHEVVLPNEPELLFKINEGNLAQPSGRFYGGTRRLKKKARSKRIRTYRKPT